VLAAAFIYIASPAAWGADGAWQVIHPAISTRILKNPDCGLAFMPGLTPVEKIPAWILDTCSIAYFRLDWAAIVDENGVPQFDRLDREVFKGYRDRGLRLGFRIMAANPHSELEYVTPKVLIDREHIPTVRHTSVYGKPAVDPVFWDDRYVMTYNRMLVALGAYLDGQPWAGPVDLGGMGDWGEMHLERWTSVQLHEAGFTHEQYLKAVLAMMRQMNASFSAERREFCYAPILMPDPVPVFDQLVAWATARGWWLRNDGCTTDGPQPYLKPHLEKLWERVGFIAEPNGAITNSGEGPNQVPRWFEAQLGFHASVCNLMGLWDLKDLSAQEIESCRDAARRVGYRFAIEESRLPKASVLWNGWLAGQIKIDNRGVAPAYGSAAYLAVELVQQGKVVNQTTLHPDPPLSELMPGAVAAQDLLMKVDAGGWGGSPPCEVRVRIVDPIHGVIELGNDGLSADGWLSLGNVEIYGPGDTYPSPPPPGRLFDLATSTVSPAAGVVMEKSQAGITLKGTSQTEWNYGWGPGSIRISPHTVYAMSVRVRARPSSIADSALYFKFGVDRKDGSWGGNIDTAKYDFARANEWQTLTAIYRPRPGDTSFNVAIETGRTAPSSIDADLGEWTVTAVPVP